MWARIDNGTVAEITDIDPTGRFHPSIQWEKFDGRTGVAVGWSFADGEFSPPPSNPITDLAAKKRSQFEQARKADEAEGITLNGARYSGSPANRQSLADALGLADEEGLEAFEPWKDSDDVFHPSVPVADIRSARSQIIKRRAELIAKEDAKYQEIDAAVEADDRDALNAIAW